MDEEPEHQSPLDHKTRAITILVESLKLYVALSTISIAGLLAFYARAAVANYPFVLLASLILFVACAVVSIVNVNYLVGLVYGGGTDIYARTARILNWTSIGLFFVAILVGGFFLYSNRPLYPAPSNRSLPDKGILINQGQIFISDDAKTKVTIIQDSVGHIQEVRINN